MTYSTGDQVSAVALIYHCILDLSHEVTLDRTEVHQIAWHDLDSLSRLPLKPWLPLVLSANPTIFAPDPDKPTT